MKNIRDLLKGQILTTRSSSTQIEPFPIWRAKRPLLLFFSLLIFAACHKEAPAPPPPEEVDYTKLPPETQEGKNTFGGMIYNQVWVPRVPLGSVTVVAKSATVFEKHPKVAVSSLAASFLRIPILTIGFLLILAPRIIRIVQIVPRF